MKPIFVSRLFKNDLDFWVSFCLFILAGYIFSGHVECASKTEDIWDRYRPLAMDEVSSTSTDGVTSDRDYAQKPTMPRLDDWSQGFANNGVGINTNRLESPRSYDGTIDRSIIESNPLRPDSSSPVSDQATGLRQKVGEMKEVSNWDGENVKDTVFKLPEWESSKLTRLINKHEPTFLSGRVVEPLKVYPNGNGPDKVLASYKILVPIYVPAIKRKVQTTKQPPVKFVEEKVTEMVPVKSVVPVVKEVIKAEPVPQQVITNFVATQANKIPARVDAGLKSDERLITTTVENIN